MKEVIRERFGEKAGWAHSVLFAGELPPFRKLLPKAMQEEMKEFGEMQRLVKKARKKKKVDTVTTP